MLPVPKLLPMNWERFIFNFTNAYIPNIFLHSRNELGFTYCFCCRGIITLELYEKDFEMGLYRVFFSEVCLLVFVFAFVFFFIGLHLSEFFKCEYDINQGPRL